MKRIAMAVGLASMIAVGLPAAALAASPTATTGAADNVTETSVTLHGRVNPNGVQTDYLFDYGTTSALGTDSPSKSVGKGTKGVNVSQTIAGLTPGTTYYYEISALSSAGGATGAIRHFTTKGHLPPAVVTGGAVNVFKTRATPTGLINPNGQATSWWVEYGLTTAYGLQTFPAGLSPITNTPLPVSVQLAGLAPATLFHYRIVAQHPGFAAVGGADATFFTEPDHRPVPRFSVRTTPGRDRKAPYTFTTSGSLAGASFIPATSRCTGKVGVRVYNGRKQLAVTVAQVGGDCKFSAQTSFRRSGGKGPQRLRVTVNFRGNGYIAPAGKLEHVTVG